MCSAYAREGTFEGAKRAFALDTAMKIAGRTSETGWITWDVCEWDGEFERVYLEVPS